MPVADEHFELSYDPQKVREVLRLRAAQRGTKVSQFAMPANTRIGNYVPQSEKRARYKTK